MCNHWKKQKNNKKKTLQKIGFHSSNMVAVHPNETGTKRWDRSKTHSTAAHQQQCQIQRRNRRKTYKTTQIKRKDTFFLLHFISFLFKAHEHHYDKWRVSTNWCLSRNLSWTRADDAMMWRLEPEICPSLLLSQPRFNACSIEQGNTQ